LKVLQRKDLEMKKSLLWLVVLILSISTVATFSLAGCKEEAAIAEEEETVVEEKVVEEAAPLEEKITLVYANWTASEESTKEAYIALMKGFEKSHPNVTIENLAIPWSEIKSYYVTSSAGGNPADVFAVDPAWSYELAAMGALADQKELDPEYIKELVDGSWVEVDGKIWCTPQSILTQDLWANKTLMSEAGIDEEPATIEEFTLALKKARDTLDEDIYPLAINTNDSSMVMEFMWVMWSFGANPLKDGANFDTLEMKAFCEWLRGLAQEELMTTGLNVQQVRELSAQEKAVFAVDHNFFSFIVPTLNVDLDFAETFSPLVPPITDKVSSPRLPILGGGNCISSQSENKEMAMEFVKHMNSSDEAAMFVQDIGLFSGTESQNDKDKYPEFFASKTIDELMDKAMPYGAQMPYSAQYNSAAEFIFQAFHKVIYTNEPIEDILTNTEATLKVLLGE